MTIQYTLPLNIINAIHTIDKFLIAKDIVPVLNYKNMEYRLVRNNRPFMTIKLNTEYVQYERLFDNSLSDDEQCFQQIEKLLLQLS